MCQMFNLPLLKIDINTIFNNYETRIIVSFFMMKIGGKCFIQFELKR